MTDQQSKGYGGAIVVKYARAASLGEWTLESIGPGLYRLRADLRQTVPPYLALDGLELWIPHGNVSWNWPLPRDAFGVTKEGRFEAVIGSPAIGPLKH